MHSPFFRVPCLLALHGIDFSALNGPAMFLMLPFVGGFYRENKRKATICRSPPKKRHSNMLVESSSLVSGELVCFSCFHMRFRLCVVCPWRFEEEYAFPYYLPLLCVFLASIYMRFRICVFLSMVVLRGIYLYFEYSMISGLEGGCISIKRLSVSFWLSFRCQAGVIRHVSFFEGWLFRAKQNTFCACWLLCYARKQQVSTSAGFLWLKKADVHNKHRLMLKGTQ